MAVVIDVPSAWFTPAALVMSKPTWIAAGKQTPPEGVVVLVVFDEAGAPQPRTGSYRDGRWFLAGTKAPLVSTVMAWAPIPKIPATFGDPAPRSIALAKCRPIAREFALLVLIGFGVTLLAAGVGLPEPFAAGMGASLLFAAWRLFGRTS